MNLKNINKFEFKKFKQILYFFRFSRQCGADFNDFELEKKMKSLIWFKPPGFKVYVHLLTEIFNKFSPNPGTRASDTKVPRSRKTSKGSSSLSSVTRACIFQVFEEPFNQMDRFRIHVPVKSSAPAPSRFYLCRLRQLFNPQISCFPTDRLKNSFPQNIHPLPSPPN